MPGLFFLILTFRKRRAVAIKHLSGYEQVMPDTSSPCSRAPERPSSSEGAIVEDDCPADFPPGQSSGSCKHFGTEDLSHLGTDCTVSASAAASSSISDAHNDAALSSEIPAPRGEPTVDNTAAKTSDSGGGDVVPPSLVSLSGCLYPLLAVCVLLFGILTGVLGTILDIQSVSHTVPMFCCLNVQCAFSSECMPNDHMTHLPCVNTTPIPISALVRG